ncbi:MAG: hypothetical protein ACK4PR_13420, partial [Gammaproteobacteria bacterium]
INLAFQTFTFGRQIQPHVGKASGLLWDVATGQKSWHEIFPSTQEMSEWRLRDALPTVLQVKNIAVAGAGLCKNTANLYNDVVGKELSSVSDNTTESSAATEGTSSSEQQDSSSGVQESQQGQDASAPAPGEATTDTPASTSFSFSDMGNKIADFVPSPKETPTSA